MLDSFEDYYTGQNVTGFQCWIDKVSPFCPDDLPEDWEIKLGEQFNGRSARWGIGEYILDALCREHSAPSERWEKFRANSCI